MRAATIVKVAAASSSLNHLKFSSGFYTALETTAKTTGRRHINHTLETTTRAHYQQT